MVFQPSTIVITGVTRGLGRAMVDEFIRLGHSVSGCARTKAEIAELARVYPEHDFQTVNVASDAEVKAWAEHLLKTKGTPDFVLNNAAIINFRASLWEVGDREFSDEIDINIKGVANVIRHFAPSMIGRKRGVFVNFCSRWGKKVEKQMAPYCATKWAVVALTRAVAEELRPAGIAAVGLNPGIVKTGMLERYLRNTPTETLSSITPVDWAKIAAPFILRLCLRDTGRLRNVLNQSRSGTCKRVQLQTLERTAP
jgi:NAD(P)-dependent dehydrogenase (short-subunit alcohol dehydrogenase family)